MYPSKVLVNVKKIADNCKFVTSKMIKDFKYRIAVVKGNAYGHGVENVVPVAIKNGFNLLAVARVSESVEVYNVLKKIKKEKEIKIIILSIIDDIDIPLCIKYGFIVPISNLEQVKHYAKLNVKGLNIQ
jgi:alanine racemase